jgi:hypothetical protein
MAESSSTLAIMRRVLAGGRPNRTTEMNNMKLTDVQWETIVAAWDPEPSRRPILSPGGEPMIYSWRPEIEAVSGASHQSDLSAGSAFDALCWLSRLMWWNPEHSEAFPRGIIGLFSPVVRLGRIPIRRHDDILLKWIHDHVSVKHEPADYDSPYFKIFLLLQAHFSRFRLSSELVADLAIVLERVFSTFSVCAHHDCSDAETYTSGWQWEIFPLLHMCVHGMWPDDPELKQIPHFEDDVSCSINYRNLGLIRASGYRALSCSKHQVRALRCEHGNASSK